MPAHSPNVIKTHAARCKGRFELEVKFKPNLKANFKLWTCDSCEYVGRGDQLTEDQAKEIQAALEAAKVTAAEGKAKLEELAKAKAEAAMDEAVVDLLEESDAPVAELNEAKATKRSKGKK